MHKKGINIENLEHTQALLNCLRNSPLLVDHLPEAVCFDRGKFSYAEEPPDLELNYSQKLGHLYEDALEYLLRQSPELNLIEKGLQIFDEHKTTIGELDYLLEDQVNGEFIHLELAVKFYLIRFSEDGKAIYPGPDPRDNWLNKLKRLQQHQLRLTQTNAAKTLLFEKYGISNITAQQLIYGKLFDHYQAVQHPRPPAMHPACQRGTWKYLSEWQDEQQDSEEAEITIIPKHLWPVELDRNLLVDLDVCSREEFIIEATERCTMIWDEISHSSQFIVPDTWD